VESTVPGVVSKSVFHLHSLAPGLLGHLEDGTRKSPTDLFPSPNYEGIQQLCAPRRLPFAHKLDLRANFHRPLRTPCTDTGYR